jgi:hypothetical protein
MIKLFAPLVVLNTPVIPIPFTVEVKPPTAILLVVVLPLSVTCYKFWVEPVALIAAKEADTLPH